MATDKGTKPTSKSLWTNGQSTQRLEPSGAKKDNGFDAGEKPGFKTWNWIQWIHGKWTDYLEVITDYFSSKISNDGTNYVEFKADETSQGVKIKTRNSVPLDVEAVVIDSDGNTTMKQNLIVDGDTTANQDVTVYGDADVKQTLNVDGDATIKSSKITDESTTHIVIKADEDARGMKLITRNSVPADVEAIVMDKDGNTNIKQNLTVDGDIFIPKIWKRIDSIEISGSGVTSINFSGLDSSSDYDYQIRYAIVSSTTAGILQLTFNNDTGNEYLWLFDKINMTPTSALSVQLQANEIKIGETGSVTSSSNGVINIFARNGYKKIVMGQNCMMANEYGINSEFGGNFWGLWNNGAATISSIQIKSTVSSDIGVGSRFDLYARK